MQIKPSNEIKINDVVNVTGLSVYDYSKLSDKLTKGTSVTLKRDPSNKYDANATGVFYQETQIGWIPKASNSDFAANIPRGSINAMIVAHDRGSSDLSKRLFIQVYPNELYGYTNNYSKKELTQEYPAVFTAFNEKNISKPTPKENKMKTINEVISKNTTLAQSAAFLEAGRIANGQATKFASKQLPMMVRGYADTPLGRLVMANIASTAATQFRPNDKRLGRLADAMIVMAYQEVIQSFDIEKLINDMLSSETIKAALSKVDESDA